MSTDTGLSRSAGIAAMLVAALAAGCEDGTPTSPLVFPVDCSVYPDQATSPHVLPWSVGETREVLKTLGHIGQGPAVEWAMDIDMPIGTPLYALTSGTVVDLRENFFDGDETPGHGNFLVVEDLQGGAWFFVHLQHEGVLKERGDTVAQGELVALSGFTGPAGIPHLHFEVRSCWSGELFDAPDGCSQTIPATFRNTQPHPWGLQIMTRYLAEPF